MDGSAEDRGKAWLEELLRLGNLPASVRLEQPDTIVDSESCWLVIDDQSLSAEQVSLLIGNHGAVIDAIQYLANTTLNFGKQGGEQQAYTIELQGYRVRRHQELQRLADEAAAAVRETHTPQVIKSLSAAERRLIHTYLKQFEDLETMSQGQEPQRFLVVQPYANTGTLSDA